MKPDLDWGEAKRAVNIEKHGVDFRAAAEFGLADAFAIPHVVKAERRYRSFGWLRGRMRAMVWTRRGDRIRVISLRKANPREESRHGKTDDAGSG